MNPRRPTRGVSWLTVFALLLVGMGVAALVAFRLGSRRSAGRHGYLVGTVAGEPVLSDEVDQVLRRKLPQGVEEALSERAVAAEAKKHNIVLPKRQFPTIPPADDPSELLRATQQEERNQAYIRALLLRDFSPDARKHIYDTFHAQLKQFDLTVMIVSDKQEADWVLQDVKKGYKLDALAKTHANANIPGVTGALGLLSLQEIRSRLGPEAADAVDKMHSFHVKVVPKSNRGTMVLQVGRVLESYEDLVPVIENIYCASKQRAFMRKLRADYAITINYKMLPFLNPRPQRAASSDQPTPSPSPSAH